METKIVAIGNSQGVRLPRAVLRRARLRLGEAVNVDVAAEGRITITPQRHPREGWDEAFKTGRAGHVEEDLWGKIPLDEAWDQYDHHPTLANQIPDSVKRQVPICSA